VWPDNEAFQCTIDKGQKTNIEFNEFTRTVKDSLQDCQPSYELVDSAESSKGILFVNVKGSAPKLHYLPHRFLEAKKLEAISGDRTLKTALALRSAVLITQVPCSLSDESSEDDSDRQNPRTVTAHALLLDVLVWVKKRKDAETTNRKTRQNKKDHPLFNQIKLEIMPIAEKSGDDFVSSSTTPLDCVTLSRADSSFEGLGQIRNAIAKFVMGQQLATYVSADSEPLYGNRSAVYVPNDFRTCKMRQIKRLQGFNEVVLKRASKGCPQTLLTVIGLLPYRLLSEKSKKPTVHTRKRT